MSGAGGRRSSERFAQSGASAPNGGRRSCRRLAARPREQNAARDRAFASDVCRRPRLREYAGAGARSRRPTGPDVGVAIDTYHVWWDRELEAQIARAGREKRIFAYHICDWLIPTRDLLLDRGMMGDGVIDFPRIRGWIEKAGYRGFTEVEIFSTLDWWKKPGDEVLRTVIERYNDTLK